MLVDGEYRTRTAIEHLPTSFAHRILDRGNEWLLVLDDVSELSVCHGAVTLDGAAGRNV